MNTCQNGGTCYAIVGGDKCRCPAGYSGDICAVGRWSTSNLMTIVLLLVLFFVIAIIVIVVIIISIIANFIILL